MINSEIATKSEKSEKERKTERKKGKKVTISKWLQSFEKVYTKNKTEVSFSENEVWIMQFTVF